MGFASSAHPTALTEASVPFLRLEWRLSLLRSCPIHGAWLEPAEVLPGSTIHWLEAEPPAHPVPPDLRVLDQRSGQALAEGAVDLPRRRVQAGIWFRLLRTLLDELSGPLNRLGRQRTPILDLWKLLGLPPRAGMKLWKPFEALSDTQQESLLRAAARALAGIEAGEINAMGDAAGLFQSEPVGPDWPSCAPPPRPPLPDSARERWTQALAACEEVIALARTDPETARSFRDLLLCGRTNRATVARVDGWLAELGIPLPSVL